MSYSPLVSIIIPAYQGQQRIARAVKSIFAQDYTNWEIVIISDDKLDYERVLADQGVRSNKMQFQSTEQVGSGAANARNVGLSTAKGDVIALLDCDDEFHPQRLSRMMPLVRQYGAAASNLRLIDEYTQQDLPNINLQLLDKKLYPDQAFFRLVHGQSVIVFDRTLINHRYMPLAHYEDYIFLMQIYNVVDVIGYDPDCSYHYYKYQGAATTFSKDIQIIASAFQQSAVEIKRLVRDNQIGFKTENLKQIVLNCMDCAEQSQLFYAEQSKKHFNISYSEAMAGFIKQWPLPASLLATR